jgi:hypothetical protein
MNAEEERKQKGESRSTPGADLPWTRGITQKQAGYQLLPEQEETRDHENPWLRYFYL